MSTLSDDALLRSPAPPGAWQSSPAKQQPMWRHHPDYLRTRVDLALAPPLVAAAELAEMREAMAAVAEGRARVLQGGDCAESLDECTPAHVRAKLGALDSLTEALAGRTGDPVVTIGRMGGQFAKPRSQPVEIHGDLELPVFRGHLVNSEEPSLHAREHDPRRMIRAYHASATVLAAMAAHRDQRALADASGLATGPWSSHEALVMDYEGGAVHDDEVTGERFLGSTHLPWIGERTRQLDSAQVRLLADVSNPVGCKLGPTTTPEEVVRLCEQLDPERRPGRLVLIPRMGRENVWDHLPPIAAAVRQAGHPAVWLCDPMHGNTQKTATGVKTRYLADIVAETQAFQTVLDNEGLHAGGLHLEVAASDVTECVGGRLASEDALAARYTTLCDPRLNVEQALELVSAWR